MADGEDGDGLAAGGGLANRFRPAPGSPLLVVVFSQVRVPAGKFGLERLFAGTRHACLFLNQPDNRWYRDAETSIDAAIDAARAASGADELILYGSSMGAFGALATAPRWPDARVVAFSPDFAVGEDGSRSSETGLAPENGEADLAMLLSEPRAGSVEVAIGLFDAYDASVAARLARLEAPKLRLVPLASGHELHDHLYSVNVIRKVIGGFSRDLAAEAAARGLLAAVADWAPYRDFAALAAAVRAGRPVAPADLDALPLVGNPGLELLKADIAAATDPERALVVLTALERRIAASPALASLPKRYLKTVPRRMIDLLVALGRPEEAARIAAAAARRYPNDAGFAATARPE